MGKHMGEGPSLKKLMERVATRSTPTPPQAARMVQEAVAGTPMYEESRTVHGDKESIQRKRVRATEIDKCSHRPGYVMESRQRATMGPARRVSFGGDHSTPVSSRKSPQERLERFTKGNKQVNNETMEKHNTTTREIMQVTEEAIGRTMWALRQTPLNSKVKCLGIIEGKEKCKTYIQGSSTGVVAPCFYSERRHPGVGGPKPQMMWFCPSDVSHTWHVDTNIIYKPAYPDVWKVDIGTNINSEEIEKLTKAGFKLDLKLHELVGSAQGESSTQAPNKMETEMGKQHPTINTKRSSKWRHGISREAQKRIGSAEAMSAVVMNESAMHPPPYTIFHLACENGKEYYVHIKDEPWCTCPDFMQREEKGNSYLACKHIYFVYMRVLGLHKNEDMAMHQPKLPREDLTKMLSRPRNKDLCAHI